MREIIFRGRNLITGEWVTGDLFQHEEQRFIMADNRNTEVIPETVGQYTGINDINGNKIFEGDIVHCKARIDRANMFVSFKDGKFVMELCEEFKENIRGHYQIECFDKEVIGNIYDNPELLGVNNG